MLNLWKQITNHNLFDMAANRLNGRPSQNYVNTVNALNWNDRSMYKSGEKMNPMWTQKIVQPTFGQRAVDTAYHAGMIPFQVLGGMYNSVVGPYVHKSQPSFPGLDRQRLLNDDAARKNKFQAVQQIPDLPYAQKRPMMPR